MEREQLNFYLQHAGEGALKELCARVEARADIELMQKPTAQTLLVPVKDPVNGGNFLGGEVLVTSAVVRVNGEGGWAMVMDDNPWLAVSVAMLDGAFAAGVLVDEIARLALQSRDLYDEKMRERNRRIDTTRVSFDLL